MLLDRVSDLVARTAIGLAPQQGAALVGLEQEGVQGARGRAVGIAGHGNRAVGDALHGVGLLVLLLAVDVAPDRETAGPQAQDDHVVVPVGETVGVSGHDQVGPQHFQGAAFLVGGTAVGVAPDHGAAGRQFQDQDIAARRAAEGGVAAHEDGRGHGAGRGRTGLDGLAFLVQAGVVTGHHGRGAAGHDAEDEEVHGAVHRVAVGAGDQVLVAEDGRVHHLDGEGFAVRREEVVEAGPHDVAERVGLQHEGRRDGRGGVDGLTGHHVAAGKGLFHGVSAAEAGTEVVQAAPEDGTGGVVGHQVGEGDPGNRGRILTPTGGHVPGRNRRHRTGIEHLQVADHVAAQQVGGEVVVLRLEGGHQQQGHHQAGQSRQRAAERGEKGAFHGGSVWGLHGVWGRPPAGSGKRSRPTNDPKVPASRAGKKDSSRRSWTPLREDHSGQNLPTDSPNSLIYTCFQMQRPAEKATRPGPCGSNMENHQQKRTTNPRMRKGQAKDRQGRQRGRLPGRPSTLTR